MARLPTLFISHGSPMLAIQSSPANLYLRQLGHDLSRPSAILVISAHWETNGGLAVSVAEEPSTIHDFGGFPRELFEIHYPAQGARNVGLQAADLLQQAGLAVQVNPTRGLDHGAWVPLCLMYPEADIPVTQVSLKHGLSPAEHLQIGRALSSLRDQGVLIIGSGSLTHNLYEFGGQEIDALVPTWVSEFDAWMTKHLEKQDMDALLNYRDKAPHAARNHPTEEHIWPLFVALGAAGDLSTVKRLHASYEYGVLAMDLYSFD
ncbi:MAG: class III extradiol ring-cleavage dioxygenase [Limnobacter sp.]|uniref:DODA-type extradiol aromatic ring-opening family dioxygenase n=1 Tax=Limnobacter sp. TaxID=2003368 RepID=UPI00300133EE